MANPLIERHRHRSGLAYRTHSTPPPAGLPDAPTYVLLHGIGMSHRYLSRLQRELASVGPTVAFDLPGFGGTPRPGHQLSVEAYATVLSDALERIGATSPVLVGHSMGVQFAVEVARQRPDLASHLVLMGPVVDERRRSLLQQAIALGIDSLLEPPSVNFIVFTDYLRSGPHWYLMEVPVMLDYPTEDRVAETTAPVLVLRGSRDPIAGTEWCRRLASRAGSGAFVELPGAHVVQHSSTAAVADAITTFVSNHPRTGALP